MAKKDKALVIVESPAKAKTIGKYLGAKYQVEASIGHIRDLPNGAKEIPEKYKKEKWSHLGVNVDEDFTPVYIIPADKKNRYKNSRTPSRIPANSFWRRTKTAKGKPSVGTCVKC